MGQGKRIVVAGATGAVGREVCARLKAAGHFVRALSRDAARSRALATQVDEVRTVDATLPGALAGVCDGMDVVVSCLGAPVTLTLGQRRSFSRTDVPANLQLLDEARRAGVPRFVYLGSYASAGFDQTRYIKAHERVVAALAASGLSHTVVRPTGIFSAFADLVGMARRGPLPLLGDGATQSNPIHPRDVATAIVGVLERGPASLPLGGPETMTREEMLGLAFTALGQPRRFRRVPPGLFRFLAVLLTWFHPRLSELLEFFAAVATSTSIAPAVGVERLSDYYREVAAHPPRN